MANSKSSSEYYEYATVNADPAEAGYFTNAVSLRQKDIHHVFFSLRGTGTMDVTLQFKCPGDSGWSDYSDYDAACRKLIEGNAGGVQWRAGVKHAGRTSGEMIFGFDW